MRNPLETRERLLETAVELVWQSNYCSVGVNEICARAGVTKGAFYHHFESKADLFYAAACHHWERTKGDWDAMCSPSLSPLEQLETAITFTLEHQTEAGGLEVAGCPFFSAGGQVGLDEEKVRLAAREMADHAIRYCAAIVRGLKTGGYLNGDPDIDRVACMVFTLVQGLLIYGRAHNSRAVVETHLRDGLYRLLDLKAEYRRYPAQEKRAPGKAAAARSTRAARRKDSPVHTTVTARS